MSFFKNLINKRKPTTEMNTQIPTKALFVDDQEPKSEPTSNGSKIKRFVEKDHFTQGKTDGYSLHNPEDLEAQLRCLKSDFQFVVNSVMEQMKDELLDKKQKLDHIGDLIPSQSRVLQNEIEDIQEKSKDLEEQKALSIDGEGWISSTLNNYERGYKKGLQDYISEKKFLTRGLI